MLYITTTDDRDAYTAHRTLVENTTPDGGGFVPFCLPTITAEQLEKLNAGTFAQCISEILNMFFPCHLTQWDIDFCAGRNLSKIVSIGHRTWVAELWRNSKGNYFHLENSLYKRIASASVASVPTQWFQIALKIAIMFGSFGQLCRQLGITASEQFNISVPADDLLTVSAAVYARLMGLPVAQIICTSNNNRDLWELIHRGELSTSSLQTDIGGIERLLHSTLGKNTAKAFRTACKECTLFQIDKTLFPELIQGIHCIVAGEKRADQTISSVYRSSAYLVDPVSALCVGGLQDYRAKTGESRTTFVFSFNSPLDNAQQISLATGITPNKIRDIIYGT